MPEESKKEKLLLRKKEIEEEYATKKKQIQNKLKVIEKSERDIARKVRTKTLIEKGALACKYLHAGELSIADFEQLLKSMANLKEIKELIANNTFATQEG